MTRDDEDTIMSTREELHQAMDELEDLRVVVQPETVAAIREGLSDIEQGRVMSVDEYRRRF